MVNFTVHFLPLVLIRQEGWVDLDSVEKRKPLAVSDIEPRFLGFPGHNLASIPTKLSLLTIIQKYQTNSSVLLNHRSSCRI
jgi:hypothetical protein